MIENHQQYDKAKDELAGLERWLTRLQTQNPFPAKGLTKAGLRKMIARLHEEIGVFAGSHEIASPSSGNPNPV